jgi:phenylacetate-CoA ligase
MTRKEISWSDPDKSGRPLAPEARLRHDYEYLRRYCAPSEEALARLLEFQTVRDEADARARLESHLPALRELLARSPYYADLLRAHGLSPHDLRTLDDLRYFPALDRSTLKEQWKDVPALDLGDPRGADMAVILSSGSTGDPVRVLRDGYDLLHMWTVTRYWCAALGVDLPREPSVVLLDTLPGGLEYESRLPTFLDGRLRRISTVRPRPLERLLEAAPHVLFSDPSGFHWLAGQDRVPAPRLMLSSAQHFPRELRARVASRIRAPVVNYYSTSETGPIAWECLEKPGFFHVLSPDVWVESLPPRESSAGPGELVVTRLRPSALPLLRYRTGDSGIVSFETCPCGRRGWTIAGFEGRRACRFVDPSGGDVDAWQLAWLFKHHALDEFRLTQRGTSDFLLEVVARDPAPETSRSLCDRLSGALRLLGWGEPAIELRFPAEIPVSGSKPCPFRFSASGLRS